MNRVRNAPRIEKIKLPVSFEGAKENVTGIIKNIGMMALFSGIEDKYLSK